MPKRTARQLKIQDIIGGAVGVTSAEKRPLPGGGDMMVVKLINARGERSVVTYNGNLALTVERPEMGECDPTNNPYWWGLEAERERLRDEAAFQAELHDARFYDICGGGGYCSDDFTCAEHR